MLIGNKLDLEEEGRVVSKIQAEANAVTVNQKT
jgi:hypothetical protein